MSLSFYLPPELRFLIKQYSMPLTRPDYKKGSYLTRFLVSMNDVISLSILKIFIEACSVSSEDIKEYARVLNDES
jgi:hypothetical protein